MPRPPKLPADHPAFAPLPVRMLTLRDGADQLAVHVAGRLGGGRTPLICVPGYHRNMSDFTELVPMLQQALRPDWPVVLVDLRGRGRSARRRSAEDYSTVADARDLSTMLAALGIEAAIFLGEGHGGQAVMALAGERPMLIAGAVLVDAGPVTASHGLVRLRSNLSAVEGMRGASGLTIMLRKMLAARYPGVASAELDRLAGRTHFIDAAGVAQPLFDPALLERLAGIGYDDVFVPQWPLFEMLGTVPLALIRTQLTDQLPDEVLAEMMARRPRARGLSIVGQGSPALFTHEHEVRFVADFVQHVARGLERANKRA